MKSYTSLVLLMLCIGLNVFAQTATSNLSAPQQLIVAKSPATVGMSIERLNRIDKVLQDIIARDQLPGMVAMVVRNGQIVYHKAFGTADVQTGRAFKTDDIFRIASMSKAITATAAMLLYEEGKFSLDDPISKWIPEFKNPQVIRTYNATDTTFTTAPAKSEITVRHLMTHTSGLSYGVISGDERFRAINAKSGIVDLYTTKAVTVADNIKKLARQPLIHNPGEKFTYALGLDVLGYLIEIWSGQSFDQFLRSRLFGPMGMTDTYFYLPDAKKDRLVPVQRPGTGGKKWERYPVTFYDPNYPISGAKTWYSGGAGLSSTAKDYASFLQMLLNGGVFNGKRFLSPYTVQLLTQSNQIGDLYSGEKGDAHYSLAFSVLTKYGQDKGNGSIGTFSWGGYFNTNYWADPKEKLIMVLMKQTQGAADGDSEGVFTRMIYGALDK
ncbi:serine hydrolase domain-containing protein [Haliscomenobacter hydrossis]|uniref:Beta-lactamase n=1 Tax=Haliscomenobacter hydrossis (strain ATCC 27775 / DSM 1100 / LMG 10767 / O) TaxID=760192 RepID=F4KRC0_HALH1|nr:serine hydrolase domain-containing protein [Haliscomenobacter hydrossis]AEE54307.1 beta-lactamase [Haliscomenobacter hydrossis DSM 1100]